MSVAASLLPKSTWDALFIEGHVPPNLRQAPMPPMTAADQTVSGLTDQPAYGQYVRMTGRLVSYLGPSRYLFADETGTMTVRISRAVSGDILLGKDETIVIQGELKRTVAGSHLLHVRSLERPFFGEG